MAYHTDKRSETMCLILFGKRSKREYASNPNIDTIDESSEAIIDHAEEYSCMNDTQSFKYEEMGIGA